MKKIKNTKSKPSKKRSIPEKIISSCSRCTYNQYQSEYCSFKTNNWKPITENDEEPFPSWCPLEEIGGEIE